MLITRRQFIKTATVAAMYGAVVPIKAQQMPRVVVVGGGYGGATAAKYLKLWGGDIQVTLIERDLEFISCPLSNLVIGGSRSLSDLTRDYSGLVKRGIGLVHDTVVRIDTAARIVHLARGGRIGYDRLIVSPGIEFMYEQLPGLNNVDAQAVVLHAWKAGPQTIELRRRLQALPNGAVMALSIPKAPYRCPPGPYERACQIAYYLKREKPRSKLLVLDANEEIVSKKGLFSKVFKERYNEVLEYRPASVAIDVDARGNTIQLEFDQVKADLLNVLPPMKAALIAERTGLITANNRWCGVDFLSMESLAVKNVHVLGDSILAAALMPKSGHMANQHAKVAAAAIINLLAGEAPNSDPMMLNTCYSFISDREVIHVSSVHQYDSQKRTMLTIKDSGGVSTAPSEIEGSYANAWAQNIWNDMLT